jgi:hypothetical protein
VKPPVEAISEGGKVARAILGEVEGMIGPAGAGFEIAQEGVDPAEFEQVFRFARADDDGLLAAASVGDAAKVGQAIGGEVTARCQRLRGPGGDRCAGKPGTLASSWCSEDIRQELGTLRFRRFFVPQGNRAIASRFFNI